MRLRVGWLVAALAIGGVACGSARHDQPAPEAGSNGRPMLGSTQLPGVAGASDAPAEGGSSDAAGGAADSASAGAVGHLGGLGPVSSGGSGPTPPALCDPNSAWGNPQALDGISTPDADERLLSMTHDELSLVFTRGAELFVADRSSADAAFGPPAAVALPDGYGSERGLALSPDGLRLVMVSELGDAFAEISRSARSGPFDGELSSTAFAALNYNASQFGAYLSSPVLAKSGESLYYVQLTGDYVQMTSEESLVFHALGSTQFAVPGASEPRATLGSSDGKLKLTQSISADERSIFFFDQALGHAAGLWSSAPGAPFHDLTEFSGIESVFTNDACDRLYATRAVSGSLDIVTETTN